MRKITFRKQWRIQDMLDAISNGVMDDETLKQAYKVLGNLSIRQLRFIEKNADFNSEKENIEQAFAAGNAMWSFEDWKKASNNTKETVRKNWLKIKHKES